MRQEGADPITSVSFYIAVVQAVLLFEVDTRFLSAAMEKQIVGGHTVFWAGDREMGKEATIWELTTGRVQESVEGGRYAVYADIYRQLPSDGGTVGGPLDHIRSLRAEGDGVCGRVAETVPVVAADRGGCPIEVKIKIDVMQHT